MTEHPLPLVIAALTGFTAAIATRVELLPEVIDFPPDRLGRITLLGNLAGAVGVALLIALSLIKEVLSS